MLTTLPHHFSQPTLFYVIFAFVAALLCIAIFLLTGLSLLETMVVSFLVDLDDKVVEDAEVSSGASAEDNVGCQQGAVMKLGILSPNSNDTTWGPPYVPRALCSLSVCFLNG